MFAAARAASASVDRIDLLLDAQQLVGPDDLAGLAGVVRRGEVGMRAVGRRGGEFQHLRPERGEQAQRLLVGLAPRYGEASIAAR